MKSQDSKSLQPDYSVLIFFAPTSSQPHTTRMEVESKSHRAASRHVDVTTTMAEQSLVRHRRLRNMDSNKQHYLYTIADTPPGGDSLL